ncbi:MAG: universal stress protein [Planctomycetota bacterium]
MKVMLAVDGSAFSRACAASLATLPLPGNAAATASTSRNEAAEDQDLEIMIVSVVNPPEVVVSTQSEVWYPQFIEHQEEIAKAAISQARAILEPTKAKITSHQTAGHIGHTLVTHAENEDVDLIVVGAKGHSAITRILLGSVSDYVATHATCDVLVIRPPVTAAIDGDATETTDSNLASADIVVGDVQWNEIAVTVDHREFSQAVVDRLCQFAWSPSQHITSMTAAVKLEAFREDVMPTAVEEGQRRRDLAMRCAEAAAERFRDAGASATAETTETDHIGEGLIQLAESHKSDLIVLGDSGRGAISSFLLGSTSKYVLRHAHCSVMIIR